MSYGAVSEYRVLPVGAYTVSMRPAGAPAQDPPMLSATLTTRPDAAYTLAGLGRYAELGLSVLDDELTAPPPGQSKVRVINAAATAPPVDIAMADGPTVATAVGFARSTGYRVVPAGPWTVLAGLPGADPVQLSARLDPNAVYTVLLVDRAGGLAVEVHNDSTGAASMPQGGVETGLGGTNVSTRPLVGLAAAGLLALVAAGFVVRLRGRHR